MARWPISAPATVNCGVVGPDLRHQPRHPVLATAARLYRDLLLGTLYSIISRIHFWFSRPSPDPVGCASCPPGSPRSPGRRTRIADLPVAYLLDPDECNNDSTNYWIFSFTGLLRILRRTGWEVAELVTVGCTTGSDPASPEGDERAFCLLRSTVS